MKLSLRLFAVVIAAVLGLATLGAAVEDLFNAEDFMPAAPVAGAEEDIATAVQEENRMLSDSYSLDVQDKCGGRCRSHKDCGDNCSTCHKKKDNWGNAKKYGSCIEKKYKKEPSWSYKSSSKKDNKWEKESSSSYKSVSRSEKSETEPSESYKSKRSEKEDCYCRKNKKYCHICTEKKWGTKKCSYKLEGECKKGKTNSWNW